MKIKMETLHLEIQSLNTTITELINEKNLYLQGIQGDPNHFRMNSKEFMTILKEYNNKINSMRKKLSLKEDELADERQLRAEEEMRWRMKLEEMKNLANIREI